MNTHHDKSGNTLIGKIDNFPNRLLLDVSNNSKRQSLNAQQQGRENWHLWRPYLSECTLGYAWEYLGHDRALARVSLWRADGVSCLDNREMTLRLIASLFAERVTRIFKRDTTGKIFWFTPNSPFQNDPNWRELLPFNEYWHGNAGQDLGAPLQTSRAVLHAGDKQS